MSNIPNTSDPTVAKIAVAWEMTKAAKGSATRDSTLDGYLDRFKKAYKAISEAVDGAEDEGRSWDALR